VTAPPDPGDVDLVRMRSQRRARLTAAMEEQGLAALLLFGTSPVQYATGAQVPTADASHGQYLRTAALVLGGRDATGQPHLPHLFTPFPDAAPPELPPDHVHPPFHPELAGGPEDVVRRLGSLLDDLGLGWPDRLAVDDLSGRLFARLPELLPDVALADAGPVLSAAKIVKTADELRCIHRAQHLNEQAMVDVQHALRPGLRQTELSGLFLRRVFELGATGNSVDPIWQPMAPSTTGGPWTTHGDVAFPLVTTDRILSEGDVVWVDTGILWNGYASDFGRTWLVSDHPRPTHHQFTQFRRWKDVVDAVLAEVRPGATGGDLTRAATAADAAARDGRQPWLSHFYLIHGVGTDSAEMPLIGTDLGPDFDESIVLSPGMVLVLEPVIWEDGHAGYRSEEIVAVTDTGYVQLSDHPYDPYG